MDLATTYLLNGAPVNPAILAVENPFIRQLVHLSSVQAKNLKLTTFVLKNALNNRGEIAQRGIHAQDKSVIDIAKLTPLVDRQNFRTLQEEIAYVRNWQLQLYDTKDHPTWWRENQEMLVVDYLLASSLCLIEIFNPNSFEVQKFFATRNPLIAGTLAEKTPQETQKYLNYLQPISRSFELRQLKVLKITATKKGFRITQPRSVVDFNQPVKITPVFLMTSFMEGIRPILNQGVLKFRYLKDNLTEREFITTLNKDLLVRHYGEEFAEKMLNNVGVNIARGYVRLPEFGISRYDYTGVRALNLSRITEITLVQPEQVDLSFIDVDFDLILPNIKHGISNINNISILKMVYQELSGKEPPKTDNLYELRHLLEDFIDSQHAIGTTTALRFMHKYMVARPKLFPKYNGGRPIQYSQGVVNPQSDLVNQSQPPVVYGEPNPNVSKTVAISSDMVGTSEPGVIGGESPKDKNPLASFGVTEVQSLNTSPLPPLPSEKEKHGTSPNLFGVQFNLGGEED